MELTTAELFLGAWAIAATIVAVYYNHQIKRHMFAGTMLTKMIKMMATGAIVPVKNSDGSITLENDDVKMRVVHVESEERMM